MNIYICGRRTYLTVSKGESEYGLLNSVAKKLIVFSTIVVIGGKTYSRHSRVADFEVDPFIDVNSGVLDIRLDGVGARIETTGRYGVFMLQDWSCEVSLAEVLDLEPDNRLVVNDLVVTDMNNYKGEALDELLKGFQQYRLNGESDWLFRKRAYFALYCSEKTSTLVCLILGASTDCFSPSDWVFWTRYSELSDDAVPIFIHDLNEDPSRRRIFNGH